VRVAARIIKAGKQQILTSPYMHTLSSAFMVDVEGSYQTGQTELQVGWCGHVRATLCRGQLIVGIGGELAVGADINR
jgi:hypothetical protein